MNIAASLTLADSWGNRGGWWIAMCLVMMVCMVAMMLGMGHMAARSEHRRQAPWEKFMTRETPEEILDHRFAEGASSREDYELRTQQLAEHDSSQTTRSGAPPPPDDGAT